MKKKILIAGDVEGNFEPLIAKLEAFDMAFCVGHTLAMNEGTSKVMSGLIKFSKPVYFIDNGDLKNILAVKFPSGGEVCKNLHYLGNYGVKNVHGIMIGYLSGDMNIAMDRSRNAQMRDLLDAVNLHGEQTIDKFIVGMNIPVDGHEGVDILLTCQWPRNYSKFTNCEDKGIQGSELIEKVAYNMKPRYHFCANMDIYYERLPYVNYDRKSQPIHITRLIALGKLPAPNSKATSKYLYGFAAQPLQTMTIEQIRERPDNCTENPYYSLSLGRPEKGRHQDINLSEADIFNNKQSLSEEDKAKINSMTEKVTLHVKGFSL